ncbi:MAG: Rid family detoxifying hydrolase [Propionibacteriaceae bacterium]|jgi:2-iminobutanoate/2-iminopropanoate deaminase|nr:Rid family detoxifying hydrolase [Propionibacteriaceae bacterium]
MTHITDPTAIVADSAPAAIGHYSQAIAAGDLIFVSGQLPIDPATGAIEAVTAADQAAQSIANIGAILQASGADLSHVVKTTVLLADMIDFEAVNEVYSRHFTTEPMPARSTFAVAGLPKGALVEIEVVALNRS